MTDELQLRIHGSADLPTLIYLPGLHGNWKLIGGFRAEVAQRVRFVEATYPSTVTWSLEDHAASLERSLEAHGITSGWLLAESFGSQIAWPFAARTRIGLHGLILAGGFVRHPLGWGVRLARRLSHDVSFSFIKWLLFGYAKVSRFRFRQRPETFAEIQEFIAGITPEELAAARHRIELVLGNDPCVMAHEAGVPVYALSGLFDPVVPWVAVRRWLRKNCRTLKEYRIIWLADHNVLGTAPKTAAAQVLRWMR